MAELVDAADSKSVFERSGSSSLPRGTKLNKKALLSKAFFFVCRKARRVAAQRVREDISRFEAT
jgi:hypothetical protein